MEYSTKLQEYAPAPTVEEVAAKVEAARVAAKANENVDVYKFCYSTIDLTTLACTDSVESVTRFARRAAEFYLDYPHIPNAYPAVRLDTDIKKASIHAIGALPSRCSKSFISIMPSTISTKLLIITSRVWILSIATLLRLCIRS